MKKPDLKRRVHQLLTAGADRTAVFAHLRGRVPDGELAQLIVSHADPRRCADHLVQVRILVALIGLAALPGLGPVLEFGIASPAFWAFALILLAVHAVFAWGVHRHAAMAYNGFIVLSLFEIGLQFDGVQAHPIQTVIGAVLGLACLLFALFLRALLFPDLGLTGPRRVKGEYLFDQRPR